jgi:hypothetical protein
MKRVIYRGGIVTFQIPATWREEYEPDGGGTFYEAGTDTGTLRLHLLSLQKAGPPSLEAAAREIFHGEPVETLPNGFPLRHYCEQAEERGTPLLLYRWEVLIPVSPSQWRLACFTHTVLAACAGSPRTKAELALVNQLVREADYSTQPGETAKKRWWKFW